MAFTVDSFELGAKMDFGDVTLNLAAFNASYEDIQLIFRQGVVPLLFNAGEARLRGLEAELSYQNDAGLRIDAAISTLSDKIKSITPVPGATATIAPGDELPLTPSMQGSFGISYEFDAGNFTITPRFDGSYTDDLTFITGSVPVIEQEAYFIGDATVKLEMDNSNWNLTAGLLNAFDKEYLIQGNASLATLGYAERMYARPRNWFVQIGLDF